MARCSTARCVERCSTRTSSNNTRSTCSSISRNRWHKLMPHQRYNRFFRETIVTIVRQSDKTYFIVYIFIFTRVWWTSASEDGTWASISFVTHNNIFHFYMQLFCVIQQSGLVCTNCNFAFLLQHRSVMSILPVFLFY